MWMEVQMRKRQLHLYYHVSVIRLLLFFLDCFWIPFQKIKHSMRQYFPSAGEERFKKYLKKSIKANSCEAEGAVWHTDTYPPYESITMCGLMQCKNKNFYSVETQKGFIFKEKNPKETQAKWLNKREHIIQPYSGLLTFNRAREEMECFYLKCSCF